MSKKPTVPPKEMPTKPANFYFRLRAERMPVLRGQGNPVKLFNDEWKDIPEATKEAENEKYKAQCAKYRAEMKLWKEAHPDEEEPSKREKSQTRDDDSDADKRKGDKSRGKPVVTKATKGKEAEEEEEKVEKGKSKGKGNEKGKVEEKPKVEEKSKKNKK